MLHLVAQTTAAAVQPLHNNYLLSVILGIIEGLTEFLPVSSTAHLRILEKIATDYHLADIDLTTGYWKMYTVVIQLGAILCLPIYFFRRIFKFASTFPHGEFNNRNLFNHPLSLTMIAFVVTAGPAFLLSKTIGKNLDNFYVIGFALLVGGIVMWVIDAVFGGKTPPEPALAAAPHAGFNHINAALVDHGRLDDRQGRFKSTQPAPHGFHSTPEMEDMSLMQAVWIGACQILSAVFPGASRSMTTIAAGQVAGMNRTAALEFSFFLSIPTMFVATLFTLKKALKPGEGAADVFSPNSMTTEQWITLAIGFVVSFVVAFGVVAWFMAWVRRRGFAPFAVYRIALGLGVLWYTWQHAHA